MKTLIMAAAVAALLAGGAGSAMAQYNDRDHQDGDHQHAGWGQDYGRDHNWRRGERMGYNDWSSAPVVDYRQHHLRHPPRGYEWRESNGRYVLAAVATGVIASMILEGGR